MLESEAVWKDKARRILEDWRTAPGYVEGDDLRIVTERNEQGLTKIKMYGKLQPRSKAEQGTSDEPA